MGRDLVRWAAANAAALGLEPGVAITVDGMDVTYLQAADHQTRPQLIVQFSQRRHDLLDPALPVVRAGTTVIAGVDGQVHHLVVKPLPPRATTTGTGTGTDQGKTPSGAVRPGTAPPQVGGGYGTEATSTVEVDLAAAGQARWAALRAWAARVAVRDPVSPWTSTPAVSRLTFASLHAAADQTAADQTADQAVAVSADGTPR